MKRSIAAAIAGGAFGLLALVAQASPKHRQTRPEPSKPAYVLLNRADHQFVFLQIDSIGVGDQAGRISFVTVSGGPAGRSRTRSTVVFSCDWPTARPIDFSRLEPSGRPEHSSAVERYDEISGDQEGEQARDAACAGKIPAGSKGFTSLRAAFAFVEAQDPPSHLEPGEVPPPPPPLMIAPSVPRARPFPVFGPAPSRWAVVSSDKASGNALFLDWGNLGRDGQQVSGFALYVVGPGSWSRSRIGGRTVALRKMRYDCASHTLGAEWEQDWDTEGRAAPVTYAPAPPHPPFNGTVESVELKAACEGAAQGKTLPDIDSAVEAVAATWQMSPAH